MWRRFIVCYSFCFYYCYFFISIQYIHIYIYGYFTFNPGMHTLTGFQSSRTGIQSMCVPDFKPYFNPSEQTGKLAQLLNRVQGIRIDRPVPPPLPESPSGFRGGRKNLPAVILGSDKGRCSVAFKHRVGQLNPSSSYFTEFTSGLDF